MTEQEEYTYTMYHNMLVKVQNQNKLTFLFDIDKIEFVRNRVNYNINRFKSHDEYLAIKDYFERIIEETRENFTKVKNNSLFIINFLNALERQLPLSFYKNTPAYRFNDPLKDVFGVEYTISNRKIFYADGILFYRDDNNIEYDKEIAMDLVKVYAVEAKEHESRLKYLQEQQQKFEELYVDKAL